MLRPIRDRRNIHIAIDAQVTKVMMKKYSDGKPRAYGVRFQRYGKMHKVVARKEVSEGEHRHIRTSVRIGAYQVK